MRCTRFLSYEILRIEERWMKLLNFYDKGSEQTSNPSGERGQRGGLDMDARGWNLQRTMETSPQAPRVVAPPSISIHRRAQAMVDFCEKCGVENTVLILAEEHIGGGLTPITVCPKCEAKLQNEDLPAPPEVDQASEKRDPATQFWGHYPRAMGGEPTTREWILGVILMARSDTGPSGEEPPTDEELADYALTANVRALALATVESAEPGYVELRDDGVTLVDGYDVKFWHGSYQLLREAILEHLDCFITDDDVAEEAILCEAIERAGQQRAMAPAVEMGQSRGGNVLSASPAAREATNKQTTSAEVDARPCDICGGVIGVLWHTPVNIWAKISPNPFTSGTDDGGVLCVPCASDRADAAGITLIFHADDLLDQKHRPASREATAGDELGVEKGESTSGLPRERGGSHPAGDEPAVGGERTREPGVADAKQPFPNAASAPQSVPANFSRDEPAMSEEPERWWIIVNTSDGHYWAEKDEAEVREWDKVGFKVMEVAALAHPAEPVGAREAAIGEACVAFAKIVTEDIGPHDGSAQEILIGVQRVASDAIAAIAAQAPAQTEDKDG